MRKTGGPEWAGNESALSSGSRAALPNQAPPLRNPYPMRPIKVVEIDHLSLESHIEVVDVCARWPGHDERIHLAKQRIGVVVLKVRVDALQRRFF